MTYWLQTLVVEQSSGAVLPCSGLGLSVRSLLVFLPLLSKIRVATPSKLACTCRSHHRDSHNRERYK